MNIEMISKGANQNPDMDQIKYGTRSHIQAGKLQREPGYSLDITGKVTENAAYAKEELLSMQEFASAAGMQDVGLQRNYMAVMSNSMSDEDFANLLKNGINPTDTSVEESVTNLDKIKATLAEAGIAIEGFNDDLTAKELTAATGNSSLSRTVAKSLAEHDLPASRENVEAVMEAVSVAMNLQPLTEQSMGYLLKNDLAPTIADIYKAEFAFGKVGNLQSLEYQGSVHYQNSARIAQEEETLKAWDQLESQATEVIEKAGFLSTPDMLVDAKYLVSRQIPLTTDSLITYEQLKQVTLPVGPDRAMEAAMSALSEGKSPFEGNLYEPESIYARAASAKDFFEKMDVGDDLTKRRQLEEVRLAMSVEANLTLLRKGISIETQPLSELVGMLKDAETQFYKPLLMRDGDDDAAVAAKLNIYKETQNLLPYLPSVPAKTVSDMVAAHEEITLSGVYRNGSALQSMYEKAGESYEALMTAPRADMGDSIRKAFANVDDILADLDMSVNDENRRVLRVMGYSQMAMTQENAEAVKEALQAVDAVVEMMTPQKTLSMIREGMNPMYENIFSLAKELRMEPVEESNEKYSAFLRKLEDRKEITENERSSYIGLYRMLHQIEKQDGRIVGDVLGAGMELTMENLLAVSRSNRAKHSDYVIDDDFGGLSEIIKNGESIDDQILKGYSEMNASEESAEYIRNRRQMIQNVADVEKQVLTILDGCEVPNTPANIDAIRNMMAHGMDIRNLFGENVSEQKEQKLKTVKKLQAAAEGVIEHFDDRESVKEAYEEYADLAKDATLQNLYDSIRSADVDRFARLYKQIDISAKMITNESYQVPVEMEDGKWTNISLKIVHDSDDKGKVEASFVTEEYGKVFSQFSVRGKDVVGYIAAATDAAVSAMLEKKDVLTAALTEDGFTVMELSVIKAQSKQGLALYEAANIGVDDTATRRLYQIAKTFIKVLGRKGDSYED